MDIKQLDSTYIAPTYARFPVVLTSGKGAMLKDEDGKEYIDMGSGIAVNTFGICDSVWQNAVIQQINTLQHTSNLFYTQPCAELAQILCQKTGFKEVFFSNSGAEANECAIKAARKYGKENLGDEYYNIVTLKNSFHGRTLATIAATGQDAFHKDFLPLTEGFVYAEANNIDDVKKIISENKCAAVMIETIQGEGGVMPLDFEFVKALRKLTDEHNMLLIVDEVQTGNGRTGKLFGYMHSGIMPDIVTTAKGLGGGLPIGATMFGEKVKGILSAGTHGSTFGGNPICCAGAASIMKRLDDNLMNEVTKKGEFIKNELSCADGVESVSGLGLMIGIKATKNADDVVSLCREKGVLVLKAKDKIRLLPPLSITYEQLEKAVNTIKEVCAL